MKYLKNKLQDKGRRYLRRKKRSNTKVKLQYPEARLVVNRSNKYIWAQVIDQDGKVIATISDKTTSGGTKKENAKKAGEVLGKELKKKKVDKVIFDRNWYLYHGRVAALADGLREAGIQL